jgi:hypothetical protein
VLPKQQLSKSRQQLRRHRYYYSHFTDEKIKPETMLVSPWLLDPIALGLGWHRTSWRKCVVDEACSLHDGWEAKNRRKGARI